MTKRTTAPHARVAIITGATGGLGGFVTPAFREAGYRISAVALDWDRVPSSSRNFLAIKADLTSSATAQRVVRRTLKAMGQIDCLVHLVGGFEGGRRVEETSEAAWNRMLDVNLRTASNMFRALIPHMRKQRWGRIVVVGATPALHPVVTLSAFSASVAALCSLVQVASAELREEGITVNALLPTTIDTPFVRSMYDHDSKRWVDPRGMASMMLWLCSEAGRDVTGALIPFVGRQPHPCFHWHGETDGM